jgi:2-polyprenyl-3-methyl-5-hydroxy-6-metoxy-1,4-benzoquinol methylase
MKRHDLFGLAGVVGAVVAAQRTGLLAALLDEERTAREWAATLDLDEAAAALVLDLLATAGITDERDGRYGASEELRRLDRGPGGLAATIRLWEGATEFLRRGQRVVRMDGDAGSREASYRDVVARLGDMFEPAATALAPHIAGDPARILDIGAGSGVWSLAMAASLPAATVTAVDFPDVLVAFGERAATLGLADRIATIAGDVFDVELPRGAYDRIVLANILHLEQPQRAAAMIRRACTALAPEGELVIIDSIDDGNPRLATARAVYRLHLALRTDHGRAYAPDDLARWMREAGLAEPRLVTTDDESGICAMVAGWDRGTTASVEAALAAESA